MAFSIEAPSEIVESVSFSFYTADEVRKLSVKQVTSPELLDAMGVPVPGGLYDPAMGLYDSDNKTDSCKTCGQIQDCPGHCGHIELVKPLFNPLMFGYLKNLLRVTCFFCHKFRIKEEKVRYYVTVLEHIVKGDIVSARTIEESSLSEIFSVDTKEENTKVKRAYSRSKSNSVCKDMNGKTWTSLQYAEGVAVLFIFFKENCRKCAHCGKISPKILNPTFGWLNKIVRGSDIRANFIRGSNAGLPSTDEGRLEDAVSNYASESDEMVSAPTTVSDQLMNLPPEFFKRLYSSQGEKHLLPTEVELILEGLWRNEAQLCMLICNIQQNNLPLAGSNKDHTMFFLKAIIVPPNKFRPSAGGLRGVIEHPQNVLLRKVQESNVALRKVITDDSDHPDTIRRWMDLQRSVNVMYDSTKGISKKEKEISGVRQLLEKKAGILRQKMMGKRVNFACRSVISPDPYLAVNAIGIPPYFALKLTYPERVTPWNVNELRRAIVNGAENHPGASHYVDKDRSYKLGVSKNTRNAISRKLPTSRGASIQSGKSPEHDFEGKVVYRHLQDGDIVLVNRQPTLHKPSMMAHVVRVLKGEKTLRMHYANCSTYNADFDGDEMNVHFPQDEISRAEAINIVNANKQYIIPTSGEPKRGLIQDHIVSAALLSMKDMFLTREEYHQLLYASCVPLAHSSQPGKFGEKVCTLISDDEIQPLQPAIWKPKPLWTGKQVITAILCHITKGRSPFIVEKAGKIPEKYFGKDSNERKLYIYNNEFIHGIIDKEQFEKNGLVHTVHKLYGADTAGNLLSIFSRLFTTFLHMHAFTCGVDDLLLLQQSDTEREVILYKSEELSKDVHFQFTSAKRGDIGLLELHREIEKILRSRGESATTRLDRMMSNALKELTSEVNNFLFPDGLQKPFPRNCLSLMTTTGAKGGSVNFTQISSLLGQQELEGKRVPRIISGKTLPCFPSWDTSCRAGGFISDRFLTGLRPQEYYFHCMAGRDGLVDTAIKTARSGYLQRCLVKNLESLKVCYDYTVRDADGSIVQFVYGEDGVDVLKTSYITELEVLAKNKKVVLESLTSQDENGQFSRLNGFIKELPDSLKKKAAGLVKGDRIKRKDLTKLYLSSLADPGEPVGVIAGQSVGEPSTQMTLNTFHLAGRGEMNVTLGIPRLQEILMTAKENIRTPIMTCTLLEWATEDDAKCLAAKLRRVCIADIVESMDVSAVPYYIHKGRVSTLYKLKMKLYRSDRYPPHMDVALENCRAILKTTFIDAMEVAITKHLGLISRISDIDVASGEGEAEEATEDVSGSKSVDGEDIDGGAGGKNNDNDDDDDDNAEGDGADAEKRKKQKSDEIEYEGDMENLSSGVEDELDGEPQSESENEVDQAEAEDDYEVAGDGPDALAEKEMPDSPSRTVASNIAQDTRREGKSKKGKKKIDSVIYVEANGSKFEAHFALTDVPHILLAEIAQKTAKSVFISEAKNIERCTIVERKRETDPIVLQTAGVNFTTFWDLQDQLDINKLVTNDIHAMLNTYGVEAARATIINEVKAVFGAYGIDVNIRHLSLIADFMTAHGGYRPMNRMGMTDFNTSPFSKMTFETATKFIVEAAFHGERDTLESPSASISLGQPVKFGTGAFDLLQKL